IEVLDRHSDDLDHLAAVHRDGGSRARHLLGLELLPDLLPLRPALDRRVADLHSEVLENPSRGLPRRAAVADVDPDLLPLLRGKAGCARVCHAWGGGVDGPRSDRRVLTLYS